ncbi:MAG: hypothetical protein AAF221_01010 [Pseudomonadota bacterium]
MADSLSNGAAADSKHQTNIHTFPVQQEVNDTTSDLYHYVRLIEDIWDNLYPALERKPELSEDVHKMHFLLRKSRDLVVAAVNHSACCDAAEIDKLIRTSKQD